MFAVGASGCTERGEDVHGQFEYPASDTEVVRHDSGKDSGAKKIWKETKMEGVKDKPRYARARTHNILPDEQKLRNDAEYVKVNTERKEEVP